MQMLKLYGHNFQQVVVDPCGLQLISIINESEIIHNELVTIDIRQQITGFCLLQVCRALKDGYVSDNTEIYFFTALEIRPPNNYSRLKMANEVLCG